MELHTSVDLQVADSHAVHRDGRAAEGPLERNRRWARTGGIFDRIVSSHNDRSACYLKKAENNVTNDSNYERNFTKH